MLFQKSRIFKTSEVCVKSMICSSFKRFSQQTQDFADQKLLYPFSQSQTSKALNAFRDVSPISKNPRRNIVLLDKLTATDYSETFRAYDLDNKTFFAQKNINLNSLASWNQVNIILRQQQSFPLFAKTLSIDYDEEKQNVKIITELQNTILKDYCNYLDNQESSWPKERIKPYVLQIIQQLTALKQLGIELEGQNTIVNSQKIFVDKTSQMLKLYDLSDFVIKDGKPEIDQKEFLEIAKQTLLKVINVDSKNLPEFSLIFKKIEYELDSLKGVPQSDMLKNLEGIGENYDQFILSKISKVLIENPKENDEKEVMFLQDIRGLYLHSAEAYQGKSDFEKAARCYEKAFEIEKSLKEMKNEVNYEKSQENESPRRPTTVFGKAKEVLFDFSYFTFKELMGYVGLAAVILIFGAVYEKYSSKKDEKKKECQKPSIFSSAWQKVKKLKGDRSSKSETSV